MSHQNRCGRLLDNDIVEAVAVDVPGGAHGIARSILGRRAVEAEAGGAVERAETKRGVIVGDLAAAKRVADGRAAGRIAQGHREGLGGLECAVVGYGYRDGLGRLTGCKGKRSRTSREIGSRGCRAAAGGKIDRQGARRIIAPRDRERCRAGGLAYPMR